MAYQLPFHTLVYRLKMMHLHACHGHISIKVPVLKGSQLITTADLICLMRELRIPRVGCRVRDHFVTCTQGTSYDIHI